MKFYISSIINNCGSRKSVTYLKILSFVESIFFPIPTDVLLAPMVLSKQHNWIRLAVIASLWSVLGGVIGYLIGFHLFELVEPYLFHLGSYDQYLSAKSSFEEYGIIFLFISAFTPIPYKIFTISAGVLNFNLLLFVIISIIGRFARFFLVALICEKYDEQILSILNKYLLYVAIAVLIILITILWI